MSIQEARKTKQRIKERKSAGERVGLNDNYILEQIRLGIISSENQGPKGEFMEDWKARTKLLTRLCKLYENDHIRELGINEYSMTLEWIMSNIKDGVEKAVLQGPKGDIIEDWSTRSQLLSLVSKIKGYEKRPVNIVFFNPFNTLSPIIR